VGGFRFQTRPPGQRCEPMCIRGGWRDAIVEYRVIGTDGTAMGELGMVGGWTGSCAPGRDRTPNSALLEPPISPSLRGAIRWEGDIETSRYPSRYAVGPSSLFGQEQGPPGSSSPTAGPSENARRKVREWEGPAQHKARSARPRTNPVPMSANHLERTVDKSRFMHHGVSS
jgi:hypothetical protein